MRMSYHRRSQIAIYVESTTANGLKFGIPAVLLTLGYLLFIVFGSKLRTMSAMSASDQAYLLRTVVVAELILRVAAVALVASLFVRYFHESAVGQLLALFGGILYFFTPAFMAGLTLGAFLKIPLYQGIVDEIVRVGLIALVPGVFLLLRDICKQLQGIRAKFVSGQRWGDEDERVKKHRKRKQLEKCWEMAFCREYVKHVCPAWDKKKPCWRIKSGCYCDEGTIMRAMTANASDNLSMRGIVQSLRMEKALRDSMSAKQKRMRCRRCLIYAEHQRQKYKVISPLVFPAIVVVFWVFYDRLVGGSLFVYQSTNRFVSFLTHQHQSVAMIAGEQHIFVTLAIAWLWIMLVSYTLRIVEYLIFDLQV